MNIYISYKREKKCAFFKKCNFLLVVSNTQFWVHFELQIIFVFDNFLCSKNEASRDRKRDSSGDSEDINHITTETHHSFWSRSFMFRSILSHIISYLFNFVLSSATSCARSTSARWWRRLVYLRQSSASTRRFTRHSCNRTTFLTKDDFKESHTTPVTFVVRSGLTARSPALISVSCMRAKMRAPNSGRRCAQQTSAHSLRRARISLQSLVRNRESNQMFDLGKGQATTTGPSCLTLHE